MFWRRRRTEPRGRPRRSSQPHLHPPPRRRGPLPGAQWQAPAGPAGDDRYSLFPPLFYYEGSVAVTLALVEPPLRNLAAKIRADEKAFGSSLRKLALRSAPTAP